MSYRLLFDPQTEKFFKKHPRSESEKITKRLITLSQDPFASYNNLTKLKETAISYRMRVGNIRIVYAIDTTKKTIYVAEIKPRSGSYKP